MDVASSIQRYDQLVNLVYQGSDERQPWLGFVDSLADALDARDATLFIYSKRQRNCAYFVTSDRAPHLSNLYINEVMQLNFSENPTPAPHPVTADEGRGRNLMDSQTYAKYLRPIDVNYLLYQDLYNDDDLVIRLALERTCHQRDFGNLEKQVLSLLTPHLSRAFAMRSEIEEKSLLSSQFLDLLSRMGIGAIVLDATRKLLASNMTADAILDKKYGLSISNGRLHLANSQATAKLRQALDMMIAAHHHDSTVQRGVSVGVSSHDGFPELDVVVKPLFLSTMPSARPKAAVMVLLNQCQSGAVDVESLQLSKMYNLTGKEAELAALLTKGFTLNEAAENLEISINTIKKHLKSLYTKLGMHRRSQVEAMLSRCTAKFI